MAPALAQSYPSRNVTVIVPYASGSSSDAQARLFAEQLGKSLPRSVVVENKPGANAAIGMAAIKAAPADGHTIGLAGGSPMVVNPLLTKNLGYDPEDFVHVYGLSKAPAGFVVGAGSPHQDLRSALAAAAAAKKSLSVGTYAGIYEMGVALLSQRSRQEVQNVSYKGATQVVTDLVGGHLEMGFIDLSGALPLIREGKLKVLALSGDARSSTFDGVPLVADLFPGYQISPWTSFVLRKETPPAIVATLSAALREAGKAPAIREYYARNGLFPLDLDAQQMRRFQAADAERFAGIARAASITPQ
jgi:tripartite-type tricarboxylate transporter receptor subunit TctC